MQLMVGLDEGTYVGKGVGIGVGAGVGAIEGVSVGSGDGGSVGSPVGAGIGTFDGTGVGLKVGTGVGARVGSGLGDGMGSALGKGVGTKEGTGVGSRVGTGLGLGEGMLDGSGVGTSEGRPVGLGVGTSDGSNERVGSPVGLRMLQTSQVSSQTPLLGQARQNDTEQYDVTYSQNSPMSSHCVGSGVGYKVIVGGTVGNRVGTCEGLRVVAIAVMEVLSTVSSRLWSASATAAVKSSEVSTSVTIVPSSLDVPNSPSPVLEREVVMSKDTSQVTESKFRRRVFSMVVI